MQPPQQQGTVCLVCCCSQGRENRVWFTETLNNTFEFMKGGRKSCKNRLDMILATMANYSKPWSTVNYSKQWSESIKRVTIDKIKKIEVNFTFIYVRRYQVSALFLNNSWMFTNQFLLIYSRISMISPSLLPRAGTWAAPS